MEADSIDMEDDSIDMEDDSIDMGYLVTLGGVCPPRHSVTKWHVTRETKEKMITMC